MAWIRGTRTDPIMLDTIMMRIPAERVGIAIAVAAVFLIESILAKCKKN